MKFTKNDLVIEIAGDNRCGRITCVHNQCPMKNEWLKGLECPVKAEDVRSTWYSIAPICGGEIVVPACRVRALTKIEYNLFYNVIHADPACLSDM